METDGASDQPAIWKISHGDTGGLRGVPHGYHEWLMTRHLIAVHSTTRKGQADAFRDGMKGGDFFYLCHGNDIKLVGKVVSEGAHRGTGALSGWLLREYRVVRHLKADSGHYDGKMKAWTPNYNSTCKRIPKGDLTDFQRKLLRPFFGMNLTDFVGKLPEVRVPSQKMRAEQQHPERVRRSPATMDEYKEAYSQTVRGGKRTVSPQHQRYQVDLKKFLRRRGVAPTFEKDNVDVQFNLGRRHFIGEIKVTTPYLGLREAFRVALGQLLDYAYVQFEHPPRMIMFLDGEPTQTRTKLASELSIAVVVKSNGSFHVLNPKDAPRLKSIFG